MKTCSFNILISLRYSKTIDTLVNWYFAPNMIHISLDNCAFTTHDIDMYGLCAT